MNKPFFLKQFFKNTRQTGAVCPSSSYLTTNMLKSIDFSNPVHIVELGPGTGCMTQQILAQLHPDSTLSCIEINPEFCQQLQKYDDDKRFQLYQASATDFHQLPIKPVDYVISGLPLANFNKSDVQDIFDAVEKVLTPEGQFVQFQYTLKLDHIFKRRFKNVLKSFTLLNMPPAFVYRCSF